MFFRLIVPQRPQMMKASHHSNQYFLLVFVAVEELVEELLMLRLASLTVRIDIAVG